MGGGETDAKKIFETTSALIYLAHLKYLPSLPHPTPTHTISKPGEGEGCQRPFCEKSNVNKSLPSAMQCKQNQKCI